MPRDDDVRKNMPLVHDAHLWCDQCRDTEPHRCVEYPDVHYRTCKRCGRRSEWAPSGGGLKEQRSERPDPRRDDGDRRRWPGRKNNPRGG